MCARILNRHISQAPLVKDHHNTPFMHGNVWTSHSQLTEAYSALSPPATTHSAFCCMLGRILKERVCSACASFQGRRESRENDLSAASPLGIEAGLRRPKHTQPTHTRRRTYPATLPVEPTNHFRVQVKMTHGGSFYPYLRWSAAVPHCACLVVRLLRC